MERNLATKSLALVSVAFLLSCQDQGSGPVGLEGLGPQFTKPGVDCSISDHPSCKDDSGDPQQVTLDLAFGMVTAGLDVDLGPNSRKKFKVGNTDFVHEIDMNFTAPGECVGFQSTKGGEFPTEDEITALRAELTRKVTSGFLTMQIDPTGLTADGDATTGGHLLLVQYESPDLGKIRIQLGSPFEQVGPPTVTRVSENVYQFTGPVVVWDVAQSVNDEATIFCSGVAPALNQVVATVNR